jgi:hypothetical protein
MAIERKKAVAFDDVEMPEEVSPNAEGIDNEAVDSVEAVEAVEPEPAGETATLGIEMLGGQKVGPGDTVKLEVVSVSDEDGTVTVKYSNPKPGGIAKASAAFNEGP